MKHFWTSALVASMCGAACGAATVVGCGSPFDDDAASAEETLATTARRPRHAVNWDLSPRLIPGGVRQVSTAADAGGSASPPITAPAAATGSARTVACYSQGAPATTCSGSDHCCFHNYSATHDGYCATDACPFGRIECDGPEDCASGNVCCAERITDPSGVALAYVVACRSGNACASDTWQLCHAGTGACPSGQSCQPTGPINSELPHVLDVCAP